MKDYQKKALSSALNPNANLFVTARAKVLELGAIA